MVCNMHSRRIATATNDYDNNKFIIIILRID